MARPVAVPMAWETNQALLIALTVGLMAAAALGVWGFSPVLSPGTLQLETNSAAAADPVESLIASFYRDDRFAVEGAATARALARTGSPQALATLIQGMGQRQPLARQMAAKAALEEAGPSATPLLIAALNDPDPGVRGNAAELLGWLRASSATDALVSLLSDATASVRAQAAWALGQMRDPRVVPVLQYRATTDPDMAVRHAALEALAALYQ